MLLITELGLARYLRAVPLIVLKGALSLGGLRSWRFQPFRAVFQQFSRYFKGFYGIS